jgi:hypothetical protein
MESAPSFLVSEKEDEGATIQFRDYSDETEPGRMRDIWGILRKAGSDTV